MSACRWLRAALADIRDLLRPGAPFYDVETLAAPWACRFRHGVVLRAERPLS